MACKKKEFCTCTQPHPFTSVGADNDAKLSGQKKTAIREANACCIERENRHRYREIAHAEFTKLQADAKQYGGKFVSAGCKGVARQAYSEFKPSSYEEPFKLHAAIQRLDAAPHKESDEVDHDVHS